MEFKYLSLLALFFLAIVGINGSKEEEYWKSVWPNTPMPKVLSDMLLSDSETSMPIKSQEEKQYWTVFFEHDLYPGKKMSLGIHKHLDIQSSQSTTHVHEKKASQFSRTRKWLGKKIEKTNQPFGLTIWEEEEIIKNENQPFGLIIWGPEEHTKKTNQHFGLVREPEEHAKKTNQPFGLTVWEEEEETKKENQPFGLTIWEEEEQTKKTNQPFGLTVWEEEEETKKTNQPFGLTIWEEEEQTKKGNQPFGLTVWEEEEETKKENQPFGLTVWEEEEETKKGNQPFGLTVWEEEEETKKGNQPFVKDAQKESQHFLAHTSNKKDAHILNNYCGTPSAIGEDKHCALSLKSMMDFAISKLGKNIKVMSSSFAPNQDQFMVEEVKKVADKAVMCHRLNFKQVIFYCHEVNATTTYMVPLLASDGTKSKALTICHHDTRGMSPTMLYEVLKVKPGTVPVCHFVGNKAIAWIPDVSESHDHPCVI